ncbi:MAG: hypothetical protein AAFN79_01835 [Pseudomonadota bacterium]
MAKTCGAASAHAAPPKTPKMPRRDKVALSSEFFTLSSARLSALLFLRSFPKLSAGFCHISFSLQVADSRHFGSVRPSQFPAPSAEIVKRTRNLAKYCGFFHTTERKSAEMGENRLSRASTRGSFALGLV